MHFFTRVEPVHAPAAVAAATTKKCGVESLPHWFIIEPARNGPVHAAQNENKSIIYNFILNFDTFYSRTGRRRRCYRPRSGAPRQTEGGGGGDGGRRVNRLSPREIMAQN